MNDIDIEYYDRQLRTIGINNIDKITKSSILLVGLQNGLGTEIAKHLVLNGIHKLYLFDSNLIIESDLENGYFYNKNDIGIKRSQVLKNKLYELNYFDKNINIISVDNFDQKQDISILINQDINYIKSIEKFNIKLITLFSHGFAGCIFINANLNKYYNNIYKIRISEITHTGIVNCTDITNFNSDDKIIFNNLEGKNLEYFNKKWDIKIINNSSFQLQNYDKNHNFVFINGIVSNNINEIIINNKNFSESLENNSEIINKFIKKSDKNKEILNYEFITTVSIMGSFTVLKAIQIITNKYISDDQWFEWSDNIDNQSCYCDNNINCNTNIGKVFGKEIEDKLINSKIYIVGCGSISSEHLKNLAFLNIANNKLGNGEINICDSKLIHKSNLNSNFLFKYNHINKLKCDISKSEIINIKPNININSINKNINYINKINKNTDIILSSVDNIETKQIIDEQSFKYNIPYIDCGTNGYFGHTQSIIPYKSELFSNFIDINEKKDYLECIIQNFPNCINHTIYWSKTNFDNLLVSLNNYSNYLYDPDYINSLDERQKIPFFEEINIFYKINTIQDCIDYSIEIFNNNYYYNIIKLLDVSDNNNWKNGKLRPTPILFDINNIVHLEYVKATINILLEYYNINYDIDINNIKNNIFDNIKININNKHLVNQYIFNYNNNNHINWILYSSNIRALNYNIEMSNFYDTKGIVGEIIPKISIISSIVSGLSVIEIIKYILNCNLNNYRNNYINQCNINIIYSQPKISNFININDNKINSWTKMEYNQNTTLLEFKNYFDNILKININMIMFNKCLIYNNILNTDNINKFIKEIINNYKLDIDDIIISIYNDDFYNELPKIILLI